MAVIVQGMQLYRFSPIEDEEHLVDAVVYIARQATKLRFRVVGEASDGLIESLTVFSHFPREFETLKGIVSNLGEPYNDNNGPRIMLHQPILVECGSVEVNGKIILIHSSVKLLRIRQPDPYRTQVGCCDFTDDFSTYTSLISDRPSSSFKSPRLINRSDYDMIEFFDPEIDVLAYVLSKQI
jgi:hypothetical protein